MVGGGSRSGKSSFAQSLALSMAGDSRPLYVATAAADGDEEMAERIARHIADRQGRFDTVEEPLHVAETLASSDRDAVVLVDCMTVWLANARYHGEADVDSVIAAARARSGTTILVSNEVGEGIVPMDPVARAFRDASGFMNQRLAGAADEVYYMHFGIAQQIK
jgi:adenosylcobinamide kinase/adenosylcobinamide-phosphate guanylyltransferase